MGKILVIDDEEGIRFTFEVFLSEEGHSVVTAKDYTEGLACLSERDFDLIFVDICLGDKTGLDILREVRERNLTTPVAVMTGYPNVDTALEAIRLGVFQYLSKPVQRETLLEVTKLALQQKTLNDQKERCHVKLEAILKSVKEGIVTVDQELTVVEVNEVAKNISGLSSGVIGEVSGAGCDRRCVEVLQETMNKHIPVEMSGIECRSSDGRDRTLTLTTSPLCDPRGECNGASLVIRDERARSKDATKPKTKSKHSFKSFG